MKFRFFVSKTIIFFIVCLLLIACGNDIHTKNTINAFPTATILSPTIGQAALTPTPTIDQAQLSVHPPSLEFTPGSCVYTDSETLSITNSGGGTLNWNVGPPIYTSGSGWLTVTPSGDGSGDATLTFSVDGTQLINGQTYTASVTITPSVGNAQTVPVSLTLPVCIN